jgi:hypothetical protein
MTRDIIIRYKEGKAKNFEGNLLELLITLHVKFRSK